MNQTHTPTENAEAPAELRTFTPGPWQITKIRGNLYVEALSGNAEESLCVEIQTWDENIIRPIDDANARLIAEAPALFAMVKDYAENADCGNGGEHFGGLGDKAGNCWHCRAVAMISKIEGRQS